MTHACRQDYIHTYIYTHIMCRIQELGIKSVLDVGAGDPRMQAGLELPIVAEEGTASRVLREAGMSCNVYVCICVCTYMCMYVYVCVCTCVCIYAYMCVYVYI